MKIPRHGNTKFPLASLGSGAIATTGEPLQKLLLAAARLSVRQPPTAQDEI